jgi:ABC-2 type transport system permease protein
MNKILIIIQREFITRVRKKSFVVMTFLGPLLFAALMLLPVWITNIEDEDVKRIAVFDSSYLFINKIPETSKFKFTYFVDVNVDEFKRNLSPSEYFGFLYIPPEIAYLSRASEFFSFRQPPSNLVMHIAHAIEKEIEREKLKSYNIENLNHILHAVRTRIEIRTFRMSEGGNERESYTSLSMIIAYISAILIYMFIFLFGAQVMRGVIEEKTNRIVEIIVSSVKPFQLMMGKVIGVALVGLTQFTAWILMTLIMIFLAKNVFFSKLSEEVLLRTHHIDIIGSFAGDNLQYSENTEKAIEIFHMMNSINFGVLIVCFLFFFIGGYLLYGSLFAAIGSAVETETDTQQFMLPVSIPLLISIMIMIYAMQDPDGSLSFWFSIIPLSSPVVMMARIPFGVPYIEIALSAILLILTFIGTIWLSAKIYRTGIFIYGKKLTYSELWKWICY